MNNATSILTVAARLSLSFVWILSGLTSIFFVPDLAYGLLSDNSITGLMADIFVIGGGGLDIVLGIWLLSNKKLMPCYYLQMITIIIFTILASMITPNAWLHPFGPLSKNVPLIVLILMLCQHEKHA